jgi:hypothetical protein
MLVLAGNPRQHAPDGGRVPAAVMAGWDVLKGPGRAPPRVGPVGTVTEVYGPYALVDWGGA